MFRRNKGEDYDEDFDRDAKADQVFHEIHDGDRKCETCGQPSYAKFEGRILCKECYAAQDRLRKLARECK